MPSVIRGSLIFLNPVFQQQLHYFDMAFKSGQMQRSHVIVAAHPWQLFLGHGLTGYDSQPASPPTSKLANEWINKLIHPSVHRVKGQKFQKNLSFCGEEVIQGFKPWSLVRCAAFPECIWVGQRPLKHVESLYLCTWQLAMSLLSAWQRSNDMPPASTGVQKLEISTSETLWFPSISHTFTKAVWLPSGEAWVNQGSHLFLHHFGAVNVLLRLDHGKRPHVKALLHYPWTFQRKFQEMPRWNWKKTQKIGF